MSIDNFYFSSADSDFHGVDTDTNEVEFYFSSADTDSSGADSDFSSTDSD